MPQIAASLTEAWERCKANPSSDTLNSVATGAAKMSDVLQRLDRPLSQLQTYLEDIVGKVSMVASVTTEFTKLPLVGGLAKPLVTALSNLSSKLAQARNAVKETKKCIDADLVALDEVQRAIR